MSVKSLGKESLIYGVGHVAARGVTFLLLPIYTNLFSLSVATEPFCHLFPYLEVIPCGVCCLDIKMIEIDNLLFVSKAINFLFFTILFVANQNICLTVLFKKWAMVAILDMILYVICLVWPPLPTFFIYKVLCL